MGSDVAAIVFADLLITSASSRFRAGARSSMAISPWRPARYRRRSLRTSSSTRWHMRQDIPSMAPSTLCAWIGGTSMRFQQRAGRSTDQSTQKMSAIDDKQAAQAVEVVWHGSSDEGRLLLLVICHLWPRVCSAVAAYTKSMGTVSRYCERMRERCFRSNRVVPKPGFNSA